MLYKPDLCLGLKQVQQFHQACLSRIGYEGSNVSASHSIRRLSRLKTPHDNHLPGTHIVNQLREHCRNLRDRNTAKSEPEQFRVSSGHGYPEQIASRLIRPQLPRHVNVDARILTTTSNSHQLIPFTRET